MIRPLPGAGELRASDPRRHGYRIAFLLLRGGPRVLLALETAAVRRLHDTGRSAWWLLISIVPLIGSIILIVLLASPGEPNSNRYGPPPGEVLARRELDRHGEDLQNIVEPVPTGLLSREDERCVRGREL